jgi:hypothetical protein
MDSLYRTSLPDVLRVKDGADRQASRHWNFPEATYHGKDDTAIYRPGPFYTGQTISPSRLDP